MLKNDLVAESLQKAIKSYTEDGFLNQAINPLLILGNLEDLIPIIYQIIKGEPSLYKKSDTAWLLLGYLCHLYKDYINARTCFKNAIKINYKSADSYLYLAKAIGKNIKGEERNFDDVSKAYDSYLDFKPIFNSWTREHSYLNNQFYESIPQVEPYVPKNSVFIPSYINFENRSEIHILFSHVAKTGGTRFGEPISECINYCLLNNNLKKYGQLLADIIPERELNYLFLSRYSSPLFHKSVINHIRNIEKSKIDFSFFHPHIIANNDIKILLEEKFNIRLISFSSYRNPESRLKSVLNHIWSKPGTNLDSLYRRIESGDRLMNNAIYNSCFPILNTRSLPKSREAIIDYLIEMNNFNTLTKIQSIFLSHSRLPNIITDRYINKQYEKKQLSKNQLDECFDMCVQKGFLALDSSPEINHILYKDLPIELERLIPGNTSFVSPLTFILKTNSRLGNLGSSKRYLVETSYLASEDGQKLLQTLFN